MLVIADAICDLAKDIGARRGKPAHIPQWVMVSDIAGLLDGHGTGITAAELQAAIMLARRRRIPCIRLRRSKAGTGPAGP